MRGNNGQHVPSCPQASGKVQKLELANYRKTMMICPGLTCMTVCCILQVGSLGTSSRGIASESVGGILTR